LAAKDEDGLFLMKQAESEQDGLRHFEYLRIPSDERVSASGSSYERSNLAYLLSVAKRHKYLLIAGLIAGIIVGSAYFFVAKQRFTATAYLFIDNQSKGNTPDTARDTAEIDSQVEVIRSSQVADVMIRNLAPEDRELLASEYQSSPFAWVPWTSATSKSSAIGQIGQIGNNLETDRVLRSLSVNRTERTYVIAINFSATSPTLAADVANGFAAAYQKFLRDRDLAAQKSRSNWIEQRIDEVRPRLLEAEKELQAFRLSPVVGESDAAKRELELNTENYRSIYQSLLQQRQQALNESFPDYFHVITPAEASATRKSPRLSTIVMLSIAAGLGSGLVATALRERADRSFRTRGQVEELLGARFVGWLPTIRKRRKKLSLFRLLALVVGSTAGACLFLLLRTFGIATGPLGAIIAWCIAVGGTYTLARVFRAFAERRRPQKDVGDKAFGERLSVIQRFSTDNPHSRYAETLREIRACANLLPPRHGSKVIGIVSALPNEGKSTLSLNLGRLLAREGARVLVADGDLRNRGLSRLLVPSALVGASALLADCEPRPRLEDVVVADETSGMLFLPIAETKGDVGVLGHRLAIKFDAILTEAKTLFDYIIVDLPPFAAVADARSLSALSDCFVLVAEWGQTNRGSVWKFLNGEREIRDRLLGVVLNKVDLGRLKQYEQADEPQYHPYREYFSDSGGYRGSKR
jgi:Mrp family chromosome partitioning ATPase/capsular polysaccharide biosynthesis protein